ncbi:MAG: MFS transporter [Chloroflexota bacterium]
MPISEAPPRPPALLPFRGRFFYGWAVVFAFLVIGTLTFGVRSSFGVFFVSLETEFGLPRAATSSIASAYQIFGCMTSFICGWAADKYGPRTVLTIMGISTGLGMLLTSQTSSFWQLYLTYGILTAIGTGPTAVLMMSTVSRWFVKKRGLALGIATIGGGMGTFAVPPLAAFLISHADWRTAFLVMALSFAPVMLILSRLVKRNPREVGSYPDGVKTNLSDVVGSAIHSTSGLSWKQAARTRSLWMVLFTWGTFSATLFLITTHIIPHMTDIGFSATEAALFLSILGGVTIACRIPLGYLTDRVDGKAITSACGILFVVSALSLVWVKELWLFYLIAAACGIVWAGFGPPLIMVVGNTFGVAHLGAIFGTLDVGFGLGAAIGPAVGGYVFDISGSYNLAFIIGAAGMLVCSILVLLVRREYHPPPETPGKTS